MDEDQFPGPLKHVISGRSVESQHLFTQGHIPVREQAAPVRNGLAQTVLLTAQDCTAAFLLSGVTLLLITFAFVASVICH